MFGNKNWGYVPSCEEGLEEDVGPGDDYYYDEEW